MVNLKEYLNGFKNVPVYLEQCYTLVITLKNKILIYHAISIICVFHSVQMRHYENEAFYMH